MNERARGRGSAGSLTGSVLGRHMPVASVALLCAVGLSACGSPSPEAGLLDEADRLVRTAEAASAPDRSVALLEEARARLHRIAGFYRATPIGTALVERRPTDGPSLEEVDQALRAARVDACRTAPDYACLHYHALAAVGALEHWVPAMRGSFLFDIPYDGGLGYATIADALAHAGDVGGAAELENRIPPTLRNPILVSMVRAATGDPDGTAEVADSLYRAYRAEPRLLHRGRELWGAIALARATAGDWEAALAGWDRIRTEESAEQRGDVREPPTGPTRGLLGAYVLAQIGQAQARGGDRAGARHTLAASADDVIGRLGSGQRDMGRRILTTVAVVLLELGDTTVAEDVLVRAASAAEQGAHYLRISHLLQIAPAWAAIGRDDKAAETMARARAAGVETDSARAPPLWPVNEIRRQAEAGLSWLLIGDIGKARALRDSVLAADLPPQEADRVNRWEVASFLAALASSEAGAGNMEAAHRTAEGIDTAGASGLDRHHRRAHLAIASARAAGRADVGRIIEAHPGTLHPYHRAALWRESGRAHAEGGDTLAARRAFALAVDAAAMVEESPPGRRDEDWTHGPHQAVQDFLTDLCDASNCVMPTGPVARGWALRSIKCASQAAGVPVPIAGLRRAAVASDPPRYDPGTLTAQLAAVVMIERPCAEGWSPRGETLSLAAPAAPFLPPAG